MLVDKFPQNCDTAIYLVSNRNFNPNYDENNPAFGFCVDTVNKVKYIRACKEKEKWIVSKDDDFDPLSIINNKYHDLIVFVHGDHKNFHEVLERCHKIQKQYEVNVMAFDWPSEVDSLWGTKNFKNSIINVELSVEQFRDFLCEFENYKKSNPAYFGNNKLTLFHHSLGNYFLKLMIEKGYCAGRSADLFDNLLLNAAAVNQKNHYLWVEKLPIQKRIYITSNKQDFNLNGVRIFTKWGKQLGERVQKPLAKNADYINFTNAVGLRIPTGLTHTYFYGKIPEGSKNIKRFYYDVFHGNEVYFNNANMFCPNCEGLGYDIVY